MILKGLLLGIKIFFILLAVDILIIGIIELIKFINKHRKNGDEL